MKLKKMHFSWTWILAVLFLLVPLQSIQRTAAAQASDPEHLAAILILDDSGSMRGNDPQNLRYADAQLFVSLLDQQDAVGALRFATISSPMTNGIEVITDHGQHMRLIESLSPIKSDGYTDVLAAFEEAGRMRQAFDAQGYQTVVIFMTDGKPEIPAKPSSYEADALKAARHLDAPFLSIALTKEGQSPFLNRVAAETGGLVISANSAEDLLDAYLQILGDLKNRSVLGTGSTTTPGQAELFLDPGLAPYIERVSFVISRPSSVTAELITPDEKPVPIDPSGEGFAMQNSRFEVFTWSGPTGGAWRYDLSGYGVVQARAILYSRLHAQVVFPQSAFEAGQPLPLVLRLVEEQPGREPLMIIGEASFAAWITCPDGSRDSLDQFYDDGTHGDALAGDGHYTRLYVNTSQPGSYLVQVRGFKGTVPVFTQAQIQAIATPRMAIDEPQLQVYEIREQPVPLQLHLEGVPVNELDRGGFGVSITAPGGHVDNLTLTYNNGQYSAMFLPSEDGVHQVRFTAQGAAYQGLPYLHELETSFEARIISTLAVNQVQIGLNPISGRFDRIQAQKGIPITVALSSNGPQPVRVSAHLEGLAGFSLKEAGNPIVPSRGSTTLTYHLLAEPDLPVGTYQGRLILAAPSGVDLLGGNIPITFETFIPGLSIQASVVSAVSPDSCAAWAPVQLVLHVESTSLQDEEIQLRLEGIPDTTLSDSVLIVAPGTRQVTVTLVPENTDFLAGKYSGTLVVEGLRPGVQLAGDSRIPISFVVDPLWVSCRRPMIFSGVASGFALILMTSLIARAKRKARPPIVRGSLIHWEQGASDLEVNVDLSSLGKSEVSLGKSSHNDIIIADESLQDVHVTIRAERDENGSMRCTLCPRASVRKGYREYTSELPLEENVIYGMGRREFKYIQDFEG